MPAEPGDGCALEAEDPMEALEQGEVVEEGMLAEGEDDAYMAQEGEGIEETGEGIEEAEGLAEGDAEQCLGELHEGCEGLQQEGYEEEVAQEVDGLVEDGGMIEDGVGGADVDVDAIEAQLLGGAEGDDRAVDDEEDDDPLNTVGEEDADALPADEDDQEGVPLDDGAEPEMLEHLKDAVDGSLRLKRHLSQDVQDEVEAKRRRIAEDPEREALITKFMRKWQLTEDAIVRHVLDESSQEELNYFEATNWAPNKFETKRTPCELVAQAMIQRAERELGGGSRLDIVSAMRIKWKLTIEQEKVLRTLSHKDLRYVATVYDGNLPLEELIEEAKEAKPEALEEGGAADAFPQGPGIQVMSRFNRLELIDPLADAAVFGDANLTFSLNLARHRKGFGHIGRVIATTFEELPTLRERYQEIDQSIQTLEEHHAEVYHGVDCTRIAVNPQFDGMGGRLGAVYYNFPHSGSVQGFFDSHPVVNWRHENLMRLFFRALRSFVKPGGVVKVSSNSGAVGVRYGYVVGSAIENEFRHVETMPFTEWHLHRYGRSYGDRRDLQRRPDAKNNQSYNAQKADSDMVYCFSYQPTGETLGKQNIRMPPAFSSLKVCLDGPFRNMGPGLGKERLARQLHERFVKEVSGTHVG